MPSILYKKHNKQNMTIISIIKLNILARPIFAPNNYPLLREAILDLYSSISLGSIIILIIAFILALFTLIYTIDVINEFWVKMDGTPSGTGSGNIEPNNSLPENNNTPNNSNNTDLATGDNSNNNRSSRFNYLRWLRGLNSNPSPNVTEQQINSLNSCLYDDEGIHTDDSADAGERLVSRNELENTNKQQRKVMRKYAEELVNNRSNTATNETVGRCASRLKENRIESNARLFTVIDVMRTGLPNDPAANAEIERLTAVIERSTQAIDRMNQDPNSYRREVRLTLLDIARNSRRRG